MKTGILFIFLSGLDSCFRRNDIEVKVRFLKINNKTVSDIFYNVNKRLLVSFPVSGITPAAIDSDVLVLLILQLCAVIRLHKYIIYKLLEPCGAVWGQFIDLLRGESASA